MADFKIAFDITMLTEGEYNPGIGESETYMGIDRSQNPNWLGWKAIDIIKSQYKNKSVADLNILFRTNIALQAQVQSYYKANYWDNLMLNNITDQQVASGLFDCSVNPCIITVSKAAQMACNVVKQKSVVVDGKFGNNSLNAVNSLPPNLYLTAFNGIRVADYYERTRLTPSMVQWLNSWLGRCKPYN